MVMRIRRSDEGVALIVTLVALVAVLMLLSAVLSYAIGSQNLSRRDQDWNAALAAAEAGVDDYLYHLNQDGSYWQYGNSTVPTSDPRYGPAPPDGNPAFSTWVPVPGGPSGASFRYDRDITQIGVDGTVTLTSTGRVGNVTRTVTASLRRRNFLDYLYFTEYETTDPANANVYNGSGTNYTTTQAQQYCAKHYYDGRDIPGRGDFPGDGDPPYCQDITFIGVDTINGPLHSNDAIRVSGSPRFNGATSTSYDPASGNRWICTQSPCSPVFQPGDPRYADPLHMPPSNVDIKNETNPALGGRGCLFTGPTAIRLNDDGTMDVISPFSKSINCTWAQTPSGSLNDRYTITRFTIPSDGSGVVYVQNVPSDASDPNYTNGCPYSRPAIGGNGGSGFVPTRSHPLGFPQKNDITPSTSGLSTTGYGCRNGDAFVQGLLNGRLTIAAENNVILFGSTTYAGADDLLGLVANNYISVYHPVGRPSNPVDTLNEVQTITLSGYGSTTRFRLSFNGQQTSQITYGTGPTAASIQTALQGLSTIGLGNVTVSGPNGGPYVVTFVNARGATDQPMIVVACTQNCAGTSAPVVETVKGDPGSVTTCDGSTDGDGYCNLRIPGITSPQTPSLFSGSTPGTSTMATATYQYANRGPAVNAALLSVAHSFGVQNYQRGPAFTGYGASAGALTVYGAIAQQYRGAVGTFSGTTVTTGYSKNYSYDNRLKYDSPPKFLNPVASAWQVVTWAERAGAYPASAP
jgi:hypothetical protein